MSCITAEGEIRARAESTKLRGTALKMRKAVDTFRAHSADNQALYTAPEQFGAPPVDGIGAAEMLDHAASVWLRARGYKVVAA